MVNSSEQRTVSRRELVKRSAVAVALTMGPLGSMLKGRTASADNIRLIDFAERRIAPDEIKSAGYAGVVNYVSQSRPGANFEAKPITREYADALRAAGLHIVSNFQYGKPGGTAPRISLAGSTVGWRTRIPRCSSTPLPEAAVRPDLLQRRRRYQR